MDALKRLVLRIERDVLDRAQVRSSDTCPQFSFAMGCISSMKAVKA